MINLKGLTHDRIGVNSIHALTLGLMHDTIGYDCKKKAAGNVIIYQ